MILIIRYRVILIETLLVPEYVGCMTLSLDSIVYPLILSSTVCILFLNTALDVSAISAHVMTTASR